MGGGATNSQQIHNKSQNITNKHKKPKKTFFSYICFPQKGTLTDAGDGDVKNNKKETNQLKTQHKFNLLISIILLSYILYIFIFIFVYFVHIYIFYTILFVLYILYIHIQCIFIHSFTYVVSQCPISGTYKRFH